MLMIASLNSIKRWCICLALLAGAQPAPVPSQQIRNPVSLATEETELEGCRVSLSRDRFTQREPIVLEFVVTNYSATELKLNLGNNKEGAFNFIVKRPDSTTTEPLSKPPQKGLTRLGKFSIKPQESYSQRLILNEWYAFREIGQYEVMLHLKTATLGLDECRNATIAFEITPFDSKQFENTCRELLKTINENLSNFAVASEAAEVLAAIKDPLVIPFLESAIQSNPRVEGIAIEGLERIGTDEAINVLITLLEQSDPTSSRFAQAGSALFNLEKKTSDPTRLELIRKALAKADQTP